MTAPHRLRRAALLAAAVLAALALGAVPASAAKLFTLDRNAAAEPGNVIRDGVDTAYFAWVHNGAAGAPDTARFCKVPRNGKCTNPIALPIPLSYGESKLDGTDGVAGAFPVFGAATGTVYVVAPRYVHDDVILYTSTDGGHSFDGGTLIAHTTPPENGPYSNKSDPTEALRSGGNFYIGAFNPGPGFSSFGADQGNFTFANPGAGSTEGSSLALAADGTPVEAYWSLPDSGQSRVAFYRYTGPGPVTNESGWTGPTFVANGYEPHLAGGAHGVYMVDYEYATATSKEARVVRVRKLSGATFKTVRTLATDKETNLFAGGAIAQSPSGGVVAIWPGYRSGDGRYVMRMFASPNGSTFKEAVNVARIGNGYSISNNARVTVGDDGLGWLTYRDGGGLQVADFTPIKPYVPPPYKGSTKTKSKSVAPGVSVKLRTPKRCVAPQQKFAVSIGAKVTRKLAHGRKAKLKTVVVKLDGAKVAKIKHKPFRRTLKIQGLPGTKHTVTVVARVKILRKHHKPKTVKAKLSAKVRLC